VSSGAPVSSAANSSSDEAGRVWTPKSLLEWTEGYFRSKAIGTPRLDAELLLAHSLGLKRLDLYLQFDRPLTPPELTRYRELVKRRGERVPVAYLTGEAGFWSLTLDVSPGTLVPRPDTETLVEAVVAAIADLRGIRISRKHEDEAPATEGTASAMLDPAIQEPAVPEQPVSEPAISVPTVPLAPLTVLELGPGTGAIPLAVCSEVEGLTWIAVERSKEALAVAARNRRRHAALLAPRHNRLWLVHGDGFSALQGSVDLIVSNPPYIPTGTLSTLMPEVSQHEPRIALDGGADGLSFYRLLVGEAVRRLRPGGRLLLELGHDQVDAVRGLVVAEPSLEEAATREDLGGHVRALDVRKR
jgi:release factor glutamine methyltransferase